MARGKQERTPEQKQWLALIGRAEEGDPKALEQVKARFDELPTAWELFSLTGRLQLALIQKAAGSSALLKEGIEREVARLRQELSGPNPTAIERLCIERIVACWLEVNYTGCKAADGYKPGATFPAIEFLDRRHERAERRFLAAVKTLATLRRLAVPNIQVNLAAPGSQQMNVQGVVQVETD